MEMSWSLGSTSKTYRGSKDMFLKRGFEEVADLGDGFVLVRKYLA
jgi:hypothetical protein